MKRQFFLFILRTIFVPLFFVSVLSVFALESGNGFYVFNDPETKKNINIWYFKPTEFNAQTPILIVMHGMNRDAKGYRNSWTSHAQNGNFMVLVPEFSEKDFPKSNSYNFGNVFVSSSQKNKGTTALYLNHKSQWSFRVPDKVFDDFVQKREKSIQQKYYIYGHSAGAQFLHRMLLCVPNAKVKLAICANAGSYTVPDYTVVWPFGLKGTPIGNQMVSNYLSKPLIILLGENDSDPQAKNLPRSPLVDQQGTNRLDRGKYFFNYCRTIAQKADVPFVWKLKTVPDADHSNKKMIEATIPFFTTAGLLKKNDP